jgi:hypothetical protein
MLNQFYMQSYILFRQTVVSLAVVLTVKLCTPFAVHGITKYVRCYLRGLLMFVYCNTDLVVNNSRRVAVHWISFFV